MPPSTPSAVMSSSLAVSPTEEYRDDDQPRLISRLPTCQQQGSVVAKKDGEVEEEEEEVSSTVSSALQDQPGLSAFETRFITWAGDATVRSELC